MNSQLKVFLLKKFVILLFFLDMNVTALKCHSTQGDKVQVCTLNGPHFECAVRQLSNQK